MALKPHGYQKRAIRRLDIRIENGHKSGLVVMATGLGKTLVAAKHAASFIKKNPGRILFLCHDISIMKRQQATFQDELQWESGAFGYLHARRKDFHADFLFATFQTMQNCLHKFAPDDFVYIITDESHHSKAQTYEPVVLYFTPKFSLALTATPEREDLRDITRIYGKPVINIDLPVALARGYLCKVDYRLFSEGMEDLTEKQASKLFLQNLKTINQRLFPPMDEDKIIEIILEKVSEVQNPKVCIFCNSTAEADRMAEKLPNAISYHSRLSDDTLDSGMREFETGNATYITTVDKFNEGIDIPHMNVLVFLRGTRSKRIFYQQLGRGLRKYIGKDRVLVLDFVGNIRRLLAVNKLWKQIRREESRLSSQIGRDTESGRMNERGSFIATNTIEFTENAIHLLELLRKYSRKSATRSELIEHMKQLSHSLGKSPRIADIQEWAKEHSAPHLAIWAYVVAFGTFNKALIACDLKPNFQILAKYPTKAELSNELKRICSDGKDLTADQITVLFDSGKTHYSVYMYKRVFGTLDKARRFAGLRVKQRKVGDITDEQFFQTLVAAYEHLGRVPTFRDIDRLSEQGLCYSVHLYKKRFGSITDAFKAAKLISDSAIKGSRHHLSKELLIQELLQISRDLGRVPNSREIRQLSIEGKSHNYDTYIRYCGSYKTAQIAVSEILKKGQSE